MRTKLSWSFLHCGKVVSLAVLYAAFFAGSSNVLAQEGFAIISPATVLPVRGSLADNEAATRRIQLSREEPAATWLLETSGSTLRTDLEQTGWNFASMPSSGIAVFVLADGRTAATTRGTMLTVSYTFSPPGEPIGLGANDMFVVQALGTNTTGGEQVASTWTFAISVAADIPPTFGMDSLVVDSHQRVPSTDFVVRLSTVYPATVTLSFDAPLTAPLTAPLIGEAAFVKSDGSTTDTLSIVTTDVPLPVKVRFTRPDPDNGFVATAFEVVATDVDIGFSGRVDVTVRNVPNSTPVITGSSAEPLSISE